MEAKAKEEAERQRARRETWPNWRGLGPQWSGNKVQNERLERRKVEMTQRGLRKSGKRNSIVCLLLV